MDKLLIEKIIFKEDLVNASFDYGQLIIPLQGYTANSHEDKIRMIPPNCPYSFKADLCRNYLVMKIPLRMFSQEDLRRLDGGQSFELDNRWMAIRMLLLEEIYTGVDESNLRSLFNYIYQFIGDDKLYKSVKYIHDHYDGPIDIKMLADLENYNTAYYSEWFKKKMGMKPKEYIQKLRLDKAKDMLIKTDDSIMEIALKVGYQHHGSLTRQFKSTYGQSPTAYRKSKRGF
ncbi:helix-turn-helix transcriptional regulator [Acidaminobacter sp. JC074]|uniref:helix-turn-helix transcriptional regulator n=1 Tax=Acidaminobacter sp. JC074 TaxID=2530199 RepID=UPI001F10D71D|nr:AraC family transcriptional regulator [Acidaminobacter sp. JC074]MCH4890858.1 helix-turn-helix transcriptional regulator [Acidaminobacter sp. JC074]